MIQNTFRTKYLEAQQRTAYNITMNPKLFEDDKLAQIVQNDDDQ